MSNTNLTIDSDSALVLFEWLAGRFHDRTETPEDFTPEDIALSGLLAGLEAVLVEPFLPDYAERVEAARKRLVDAYLQ